MTRSDEPRSIRKGEEIDLEGLMPYLASINPDWSGIPEVKQFRSGFSNLTYLFQFDESEFVLRRPPFGSKVKSGHDMNREYKVMKGLKEEFKKVPIVYQYCGDTSIIGSEFYIMERVRGTVVRGGDHSDKSKEDFSSISTAFLDTLVELHKLDYKNAGLTDLGRPEGYNQRQVEGWCRRYSKAQTEDVKVINSIMDWVSRSIPKESDHTLIHNDFKYDNIMFSEETWQQVKAVFDWEMATLGDPLMDFGMVLAYWAEEEDLAVFGELISLPTYQSGNPTRTELVDLYAERSGRDVSNLLYYYVFGLFKIAVIVQQIYYRYHHGMTSDKRFAALGKAANGFCFKASRAIEKGRFDNLF